VFLKIIFEKLFFVDKRQKRFYIFQLCDFVFEHNSFSPQRHKVIHEGTSKSKVQAVRASRNGMR